MKLFLEKVMINFQSKITILSQNKDARLKHTIVLREMEVMWS